MTKEQIDIHYNKNWIFFGTETKSHILPIFSKENFWFSFLFNLLYIIIALIFIITLVSFWDYEAIIFAIIIALTLFIPMSPFSLLLLRIRRGPAEIRIDKDGLYYSPLFTEPLPWTALSAIRVWSTNRWTIGANWNASVTLIIQDRSAVERIWRGPAKFRVRRNGSVVVRIPFGAMPKSRFIGAAISAAAAKYAHVYNWFPVTAGTLGFNDD